MEAAKNVAEGCGNTSEVYTCGYINSTLFGTPFFLSLRALFSGLLYLNLFCRQPPFHVN